MQRMPDQVLWPVRGVINGDICPDPLGVSDDCAPFASGRGLPAPAKNSAGSELFGLKPARRQRC